MDILECNEATQIIKQNFAMMPPWIHFQTLGFFSQECLKEYFVGFQFSSRHPKCEFETLRLRQCDTLTIAPSCVRNNYHIPHLWSVTFCWHICYTRLVLFQSCLGQIRKLPLFQKLFVALFSLLVHMRLLTVSE